MSRKLVLAPDVPIAIGQSLATSFTSVPTMIDFQDNIGYQINITTTNSTGTFTVQASLDYLKANGLENGRVGNWVTLPLSGSPTAGAANDSISISLNQLPFRAVRLVYTAAVAGTGVADIYIMSKEI